MKSFFLTALLIAAQGVSSCNICPNGFAFPDRFLNDFLDIDFQGVLVSCAAYNVSLNEDTTADTCTNAQNGLEFICCTASNAPTTSPTPAPSPSPTPAPSSATTPAPTNAPFSLGSLLNICFPGSTTVDVQGKGTTLMHEVKVGDYVLGQDNQYSEVLAFGTYKPDVVSQYIQLVAEGFEETPIELSREHLVFINGMKSVPADFVKVGDKLNGNHVITEVKEVIRQGAFSPLTASGTVVVNGVLASSYVSFLDYTIFDQHSAFHAFAKPFIWGWFGSINQQDPDRNMIVSRIRTMLAPNRYNMSPNAQYLLSFIAIPIHMLGAVYYMIENYEMFLTLAVVAFVGYKSMKRGSSKTKLA